MPVLDITAEDPFLTAVEELHRNPYPLYDRIREKGKLLWSSQPSGHWITASYDTVVNILTDGRFGVEVPESEMETIRDIRHNVAYQDLITGLTKFMLAQDPPAHTRVRKLANKAFTRYEVNQMGEKIEGIIDELLGEVVASGKMDVIADFAFPLPMRIISGVLGLPDEDKEMLRGWSEAIVAAAEPVVPPDQLEVSAAAARDLFEYLKVMITDRRKNPKNDLLSAFVLAEEEGNTLNMDELLANMLLLLIAGHETTVNLIGSGVYALIRNPEAMEKLRQNPALIPTAVEEFLRIESPLQITDRYVREDMEFEGQKLLKDQRIAVILGGANHDPAQFDDPAHLNIERSPNKHLAFSLGIHFCLGAPLVRFETNIAFAALLKRLHNITLDASDVTYKPFVGFRGLAALPIKFTTV